MSVPPALYERLFWDKRILRDAMKGLLPDALREREKVPFFHGKDTRYTQRLMYQLLRADKNALVEEGLAGARLSGAALDEDVFMRLLKDVPNDPEFGNVDRLLRLVNMGLLASMGRDPGAERTARSAEVRVAEVVIDDWQTWRREVGIDMVKSERNLGVESVPSFTKEILLVRCENGDPGWKDDGGYYVLRGDKMLFMLDAEVAPWLTFLRAIDGKRSIGALLTALGLHQDDIWKHLEEAIELDVLTAS